METSSETKGKYFALVFTIGVHAILFLLFLVIEFINPGEMLVNKASAESSSFIGLDMSSQNSEEIKSQETKSSSSKSINTVSQNKNDIISRVTDPNENSLGAKANVLSEQPEEDLQGALTKLRTLKNNQGNKNLVGGESKSEGNKLGENKKPTSGIVSTDVILKGRELIKKPEALTDSKEEGIVVVEIIVDEAGNVIKAIPGQRGSTTTSVSLFEKAKQKAIQAKFNISSEGIKEQRGTYTFVFNLQ